MSGENLLESPAVFLLWGLWFLSTAAGLMLKGEAAKPACPALVLKMKLGWLCLCFPLLLGPILALWGSLLCLAQPIFPKNQSQSVTVQVCLEHI